VYFLLCIKTRLQVSTPSTVNVPVHTSPQPLTSAEVSSAEVPLSSLSECPASTPTSGGLRLTINKKTPTTTQSLSSHPVVSTGISLTFVECVI